MSTPDTRPVVVAVDGTPGSDGAIRYGAREATVRAARLHLVHVVPGYPPVSVTLPEAVAQLRAVGRSILEDARSSAHELAAELEVSTELDMGSRGSCIVWAAQDAQLVVVGRETRRGLERVLSGTVTAGVASRARCPVVVVPSFWTGESSHGRIVVGLKSRTYAHELLSHAFEVASARGAGLTLVTAWELPDPYLDRIEVRRHAEEWIADGTRLLEELLKDWHTAYPDVPVELRVVHGRAASVLLDAARDADLLMLARHRHAIPPYGHLGGTAHVVLRATEMPVEMVPADPVGGIPTDPSLVLEKDGAPVK